MEPTTVEPAMPGVFFRAGVGVVVRRPDRSVLVLRRPRERSWQFPQGGLETGEEPRAAALRELWEETALGAHQVRVVAEHPAWLSYELPAPYRSARTGRGQTQRWYLAELVDDAAAPDLSAAVSAEFDAYEWVTFAEAVARIVAFKRPVYEQLRAAFDA
jgi:putative (di)nucleoside polyphosphate hydrolase